MSIPPELLHLAATHGPHLLKEIWEGIQSDRHREQQAKLGPDLTTAWLKKWEQDRRENPLNLTTPEAKRKFRADAKLAVRGLTALRRGVEGLQPVAFNCLKCSGTATAFLGSGPLKCGACATVMGITPCSACGQILLYFGSGTHPCLTCTTQVRHPTTGPVTRQALAGQIAQAIVRLKELQVVYAPASAKKNVATGV